MGTREVLWLELAEVLPPLPDGWWETAPQRLDPVRTLVQVATRFVKRGRSRSSEHVVVTRFVHRGGRPSSEHVIVGTGPDEVAALQDLLTRARARYQDERG